MNKQSIRNVVNKRFNDISQKINKLKNDIERRKKIGNFYISDHVISTMKTYLNKSKENNIEYGSMLCVNPLKKIIEIELSTICIGEKCTLKMIHLCNKKSYVIVGNYHTHPSVKQDFKYDSSFPSIRDIITALDTDAASVLCIGSVENKKISCFTRKLNISYREFEKNIIHDIIIELEKYVEKENTTKDSEIYHKKMDEIISKYYNKTEL